MTPEVVAALETAALGDDSEVRALAAQALGRRAPERAAALAERLLSDGSSFHRLALGDGTVAARHLCDGRAPGPLSGRGPARPDRAGRRRRAWPRVAEDRTLPEATRLGAIEGLAAMAREPAEDVLRRIGLDADDDEELRKAAWRALRRSGRMRRKAGAAKAEVMS